MTPMVNVDVKMPKALLRVLSLHETFCVVSGITEVTHDDVVRFIQEKAGDQMASLFKSEYLVSSPGA